MFVPKAAGQHDDLPTQLSVQIKETNKAALTNVFEFLNFVYKKLLLITDSNQYGQHIKDNLSFTNLSVKFNACNN